MTLETIIRTLQRQLTFKYQAIIELSTGSHVPLRCQLYMATKSVLVMTLLFRS